MIERYTQVPRATLWLVEGGEIELDGQVVEVGSIYIGKATITNEQLEAYAPGRARSPLSPGDDDPAAGVAFEEAAAYCDWYAKLAKKPFRLPTEAEWEHTCRGGTRTRYFFGDDPGKADRYVWHQGNSGGHAHGAESTRANPAGVHEMLGNVWEWTSSRVLRGGSFRTPIEEMGCAVRRTEPASLDDVGFRIVRSL
jgi:formylglycine-generating enzyme required for sulfatase activity